MISIILTGGLGNQMFQYAAARALSIRENGSLHIDTYTLKKKSKATKRIYELNIFSIAIPINTSLKNKIGVKILGQIRSKKNSHRFLRFMGIFRDEKAQYYDKRIQNLSGDTTLYGYFQNELYFKDVLKQIREDFTFRTPLKDKNFDIQRLMSQSESVAIHIRRGDYTNNNSNLPPLDISHYQKAIEYMITKLSNPHFYIFSDDMQWVRENLNLTNINHTSIDWNKNENSYIDMQLMSLCKHNIIANSSFSWWGAWLNSNTDKIVIAPKKWYKNDSGTYPEGFIPQTWTIL